MKGGILSGKFQVQLECYRNAARNSEYLPDEVIESSLSLRNIFAQQAILDGQDITGGICILNFTANIKQQGPQSNFEVGGGGGTISSQIPNLCLLRGQDRY